MFPQKNRLSKKNDFSTVFKNGKSGYLKILGIKLLEKKENSEFRCGVVVGKKISKKAVERNLVKRRIRNSVLELRKENVITGTQDFIIISLPTILDAEYGEIKNEIKNLYLKISQKQFGNYKKNTNKNNRIL